MERIRFTGNIIARPQIIIWSIISVACLLIQALFVFYLLDEILFQLFTGFGLFIYFFVFLGIVASSLSIGQKVINLLYGNVVEILIDDNNLWEIWTNGRLQKRMDGRSIKCVKWQLTETVLNRITFQSDSALYINVGSIWKGASDNIVNQWLHKNCSILAERLNTKLKETVTENNQKKIKYYTYSVQSPDFREKSVSIRKRMSIIKRLLIVFLVLLFTAITIFITIKITSDDDPDNKVSHLGKSFSSSNYSSYDSEIYFLRIGSGYYKVRDADYNTFRPLSIKKQYGSDMGIDTSSVFYGNKKIEGIDRQTVRYIGAYFVSDSRNVFYKNQMIEEADAATFALPDQQAIYSYKYPYGRDKTHLFYKKYLLEGMNPNSVHTFEGTLDYISDNKYVYYRNTKLEDVDAKSFKAEYIDYQLTYATDGRTYFINGKPFPDKVSDIYIGNATVDNASLRLLQKKCTYSGHMIFYDNRNIYYFNEAKQKIIRRNSYSKNIEFRLLGEGLFTDGENIYFFIKQNIRSRKRAIVAIKTKIVRLEDVTARDFYRVKELSKAVVWSDGKSYYITSYDREKYGYSSLCLLKSKPSDKLSSEDVSGIPDYSSWLEIKTKPRKSFEKETD